MMKTAAIIPARGGSKRLPHKNTLLLGKWPLLVHSILFAQQNENHIDGIFVSTDNAEIAKIAEQFGATVIHRPPQLATDTASTLEVLQHALTQLPNSVERIILLQPTNPIRPIDLLENALSLLQKNTSKDLFTVSPVLDKLGRIQDNCFLPYNYTFGQRSQDMNPLYKENGLLYIIQKNTLLSNQIIAADALPLIIENTSIAVDIDTQEDFLWAEFLLSKS